MINFFNAAEQRISRASVDECVRERQFIKEYIDARGGKDALMEEEKEALIEMDNRILHEDDVDAGLVSSYQKMQKFVDVIVAKLKEYEVAVPKNEGEVDAAIAKLESKGYKGKAKSLGRALKTCFRAHKKLNESQRAIFKVENPGMGMAEKWTITVTRKKEPKTTKGNKYEVTAKNAKEALRKAAKT